MYDEGPSGPFGTFLEVLFAGAIVGAVILLAFVFSTALFGD